MIKLTPFRILYNVVLTILAIISFVLITVVSLNMYDRSKRVTMYTATEIEKQVKDKYSDFNFQDDDSWEITITKNNDKHAVNIKIVQKKELCKNHYQVTVNYKLVKGKYEADWANKIELIEKDWLFEGTDWEATTKNKTKYTVSFLSDMEAEISIEKNEEPYLKETDEKEDESTVEVTKEDESKEDESKEDESKEDESKEDESKEDESKKDESKEDESKEDGSKEDESKKDESKEDESKENISKITCKLEESIDKESYSGSFIVLDDDKITLKVTEDTVKLYLGDGKEEVILERK